MSQRIGIGYDIHRFVHGRKLILGGIEISHDKGLEGHSDADVLLHAVCDALLGAAGLGDIGDHFPNTDQQYKDISSVVLLKRVYAFIDKKGFAVENIDTIIYAEEPKMTPIKERMRHVIATAVRISDTAVNIKATTLEGLGSIGRKEGIAAHAIALLKQKR
jgi:2-C-methyl-D-erythritol 2,4-cyclodiphosphate synthase